MRSWLLLFPVASRLLRAEPSARLDALTEPDAAASLDAGTWAGDEAEAELDRHEVAMFFLTPS